MLANDKVSPNIGESRFHWFFPVRAQRHSRLLIPASLVPSQNTPGTPLPPTEDCTLTEISRPWNIAFIAPDFHGCRSLSCPQWLLQMGGADDSSFKIKPTLQPAWIQNMLYLVHRCLLIVLLAGFGPYFNRISIVKCFQGTFLFLKANNSNNNNNKHGPVLLAPVLTCKYIHSYLANIIILKFTSANIHI